MSIKLFHYLKKYIIIIIIIIIIMTFESSWSSTINVGPLLEKNYYIIIIITIIIIIANEKPRGSLLEQCTIVPGAEKISNLKQNNSKGFTGAP